MTRYCRSNGRAHGIERNRPVLRVCAVYRIPTDQHRSDRRDGRRDGRELAGLYPAHYRPAPDSVTIYQMEVPYNTTIFKEMRVMGQAVAPVADWPTKRAWVDYGFSELEKAGYTVSSAYTAVKDPARTRFLYRDLLWTGADMIGLGVASFSHVNGTHFQNEHDWQPYIEKIEQGTLPIYRALTPNEEERMIREFILQMKLGHVHREYFQRKFGVDVRQRFAGSLEELEEQGF